MNNLSERVKREFNEWQERYEIPKHMEFEVKTLLKLQEEYDQIEEGSNTTLTRKTILEIIQRIHRDIRLNPIEKAEPIKPMYVDLIRNNDSSRKVTIYYNDNIIVINNKNYSYKNYASVINSLISPDLKKENLVIYVDTRSFGMGLFDELAQYKDLVIKQLKINRNIIK